MAVPATDYFTPPLPPARPPRVLRPYVTWRSVANGAVEQLLDIQAWCLDVERTTLRIQTALRDSRRHDAVHDRHLALALVTADTVTAAVLALLAVPLVVAARIRWTARGLCRALEAVLTKGGRA